MESSIFTLEALIDNGYEVAFVNTNRVIDQVNVKRKKESIQDYGQLTPLVVVDGTLIDSTKFNLISADSKEPIKKEKYNKCVVIVEGQHRYLAIKELREEAAIKQRKYTKELKKYNSELEKDPSSKKSKPFAPKSAPNSIKCIKPLNESIVLNKLIPEINNTSIAWKNKDYIYNASVSNPDNEVLKYINELTNRKAVKGDKESTLPTAGYPLSTISLLLTFNKSKISSKLLSKVIQGNDNLPSCDIETAKEIIKVATEVGFTEKYLALRYFMEYINDERIKQKGDINKVLAKIKALDVDQVQNIMDSANKDVMSIRKCVDKIQ